jgi:hypothetical protein
VAGAVAVVAAAYAANSFFNHTASGLALKSYGDLYVSGSIGEAVT